MTYVMRVRIKHFKTRMWQRLGIHCTDEILAEIIRQIQSYQSKAVMKVNKRRSIHVVKINDVEFYVVYSTQYKIPLTCYSLNHRNLAWEYPHENNR